MKKTYILALAALAMAFSCQKAENSPEATSEPVVRTFTCTFAQPDTKLAINDSDGKTTWEVGDQILVHGEGSSNRQIITLDAGDISADGKKATITVTSVSPYNRTGYVSNYYASYPASACPTGNWYWNSRFSETNHFLMFGCNDGDTFTFYNLCGIISFIVDDDFDSYIFSGNSGETVGYSALQSRIRITSEHAVSVDYVRTGTNDDYTTVPLTTINGTVVSDGSTINYICLPNGANFTGGFTIKFLKSGSVVKTLSTTKSVNVPRNSYRPMGDVTAYLKTYVPPTSHNSSIDMTGATALDGSGNANCYIVDGSDDDNASKVFTFKAYKGNGTAGVGTVASTEILWETWNNTETVTAKSVIAAVDFDKQDANDYYTIVFKMPATLHAGNALIAAKDAGDNILWSWHIWVPATTITQSTYGGIYGAKEIMDRNVGALVATVAEESAVDVRSYGMYYQWGRKDPFLAPATTKNGSMTYTAARMSVEESIQNPTAYIKTGGDSVKDWNTASSTALWGTSKTEYDPCPPGYVVPTRNKSTIWWADTPLDLNAEFNTSYGWFKAGVTYDSENSTTTGYMVFPICGYIDQGSLSNLGSRAYIWSAYSSSSDLAYQIYFDGSSKSRTEQRKSRAGSVRCVAE